ncbi:MAG TPA: PA14 domain-containing protein [Anaerolineae bacterium]|jgi:uncharacterized protein YraI|nr:PA14 domain-containing protein [Anaerolineae bacterium]
MSKIRKAGWKVTVALLLAGLIIMAIGKIALAQSQGGWRGEYYNNMTLGGSPVLVRVDKSIDFDWGTGSPEWGVVGADNFSVRWTGNLNVSAGRYRFIMSTDDGARLWVNGQLVIDKWLDQQGGYHEVTIDLPNGSAYVQMEYYENQGGAKALMTYVRQNGGSGGSGNGPWRGEYFNNTNLSGQSALVRNEADINFDWGAGSPVPGKIGTDNFSARWTRNLDLMPGRYQFATTTDDGVRLWVNSQLIIDQWRDQHPTTYRAEIDLSGGSIPVKMEYYENTGGAKAQLSWALVYGGGQPGGGNPTTGPWRAEYFNNTGLSGMPVLARDEGQPSYYWGNGSPAPGVVGNDYFSARWSRTLEFIPGRYRFAVTTDDGVRLWVNNQLIIDNWRNQPAQTRSAEIDLAGGSVPVRMEYYEADMLAEARLSWQRIGIAANTGGAPMASVTSYYLNVRQGPGVTHAIITQLSRGQMVQLAGIRNADATWVKVILPDGRQGWCYAGFLQSNVPFSGFAVEGGQPSPVRSSTATVANANYVNVRTGPGVENSRITAVPRGTIVELLGRNAASSWARIQLSSGTVGWMNAYYLSSATTISSLSIVG